ncbi:polysaccharide biosynthesis/export family protein [Flavihumibacter sp. CACIAM 22H1]|uniref:polysaccharide biosynthesis/export family protein n=1 Tax=Flavihumibacter sp. CACIAM 22H1 TaxID=1812911 RepID=UPI0025B8E0A7|nr:polysaccharide biosynthesis/export family protein [Flavihumibacter sp. CACIAM 22H1]
MNDLKDTPVLSDSLLKGKLSFEYPIQQNDLLWVTVGGPNSVDLIGLNSAAGIITQGAAAVSNQGAQVFGYLVESDGTIKLPYVGRLKVEGLTRIQLEDSLAVLFADYTSKPVVNVRFLNYKITVMGEVARPGSITIPNERISILEALGMAGDLTIMGKRETVLVIREINGQRTIGRVNLLSKDLLTSPYYYLRTNDVIYVEPAPAKFFARERLPQFISLAAGSLSLLAIILTISR